MVEEGKKYKIYSQFERKLIDEVEVWEVLGNKFTCYNPIWDEFNTYDLDFDEIIIVESE